VVTVVAVVADEVTAVEVLDDVVVVEAVVDVVVLVVVDLLQDASTSDARMRKVSNPQIIPLFIQTSFYY
jgi:hypothetical protein